LHVLKKLSLEGDPEEQRLAHEHLHMFAPHLAEGHEARFRGAESWKSYATEKFPHIIKAEAYKAARKELRSYGVERLREELGAFVGDDGLLTVGMAPFNIFARVAAGVHKFDLQSEAEFARRQPWLGHYGKEFVLMINKAQRRSNTAIHTHKESHKDMTEDEKEQTKGKSGMSQRHEFLLIKDRRWDWFNILTPGLVPGGVTLSEAIETVSRMKEAALYYTRNSSIPWSKNVGMYFHCYPHVGVNSLHMHIVDLDRTGPTWEALALRNLPVDEVLRALREELARNAWCEQEAALTTEFQHFLKRVTARERRKYKEVYLNSLKPEQRERMRRTLLYDQVPVPWRRAKDPLQRLDERLRSAGRPILSFM
jgi:hypothetical protein